MNDIKPSGATILLMLLFLLSACLGGGGSDSGSEIPGSSVSEPTSCKPYSYSSPISNWTIERDGTYYDITIDIDTSLLEDFKNIQSGCSISRYELAIISGSNTIIYSTDSKPPIAVAWREIFTTSNQQFINNADLASLSYASACVRAYSNLNEQSNWYCSSKAVPASTGSGSTTDTTPPSSPSNLTATKPYWSTSSQTVTMGWSASSDTQSGIAKYWGRIFDSNMVQIGSDISISGYSSTYSYNASSLTGGKTYYFSIAAENGVGLISTFRTVSFYKPYQVTVYLKYHIYTTSGCVYPNLASCTSAQKTMYDTQLLDLINTRYAYCDITNKGMNVFEINCQTSQSCRVTTIGGTCYGSPANTYYGTCGAVHGVYISTASSCNSWNPTLTSP